MWVRTMRDGYVNLALARDVRLHWDKRSQTHSMTVHWSDETTVTYEVPQHIEPDGMLNKTLVPAEPGRVAQVVYFGSVYDTERPTADGIVREQGSIIAWRLSADATDDLDFAVPVLDCWVGNGVVIYRLPDGRWQVAEFEGMSGELEEIEAAKLAEAQLAWDRRRVLDEEEKAAKKAAKETA